MKIAVIGTGYVGLVSGICLASKGHSVKCFDKNTKIVNQLTSGVCHIYENGLNDLLVSSSTNISFGVLCNETENQLVAFDAVIVAVGTPTVDGNTDLSQIGEVAKMMGRLIKTTDKYISLIIKSTVVPGTTDTFVKNIIEDESGKKLGHFGLGMNPEFLREGNAVDDFLSPDRIVLGYEDEATLDILREMYRPWSCQKVELNSRSAEMMKYVNNTLLATLISSVNEYANIARELGNIDFQQVMHGVHLDNRWSPLMEDGIKLFPKIIDYLKPGCGYGGSCFPKDVKALSALSKEMLIPPKIIDAVIAVNDEQPNYMIRMLEHKVKDLSDKRVLILGLAFKPETDDVRESVSLKLINLLNGKVSSLSAHDPIAVENSKKQISQSVNIDYIDDWQAAVGNTDIVIIATNWMVYKSINNLAGSLTEQIIFDTRSLLDSNLFNSSNYLSIN
jgi:UDPglucose 6-dehydrogenase